MSPTRRDAALSFMAAGAAALPASRALAQPAAEQIELPDSDEPNAKLDTTQSANEHMLAPVSINDQGPFYFLLDTGANTSCVSHRLVEKLELTPAGPARVHTVVGVRDRPSVIIDRLQVGSRHRRGVLAPSLPIDEPKVDGVLGVDWLKGQRLVLDFKDRKMEITRSQADKDEPGVVVVPARRRHGQLTIVDAEMSGKRISAIIDSGAQTTLCNLPLRQLARGAPKKHPTTESEPEYVRLESLAGETFRGEIMYVPFLRLGGLHLGNVQVIYANAHVFDVWGLKDVPALVLGMDLLKQFEQVALDFGRSAVRFEFT